MSITSTYPVQLRLLKQIIREEGYVFHREPKRTDVSYFLRGIKGHIPFKFSVAGQTGLGLLQVNTRKDSVSDAKSSREWALKNVAMPTQNLMQKEHILSDAKLLNYAF